MIYKLDPNNLSPEVRKIMKTLLAQENAKKSIKAQKKKHGKGYKDEMGRRGKLGGRPKKNLTKTSKIRYPQIGIA